MKWLLLIFVAAGCGPSVRERYVTESAALEVIEGKYNESASQASSAEMSVQLIERQLAENGPDEPFYIGLSSEQVSREEAAKAIPSLKAEMTKHKQRANELLPKVEVQRKRVADLESEL